MAENENKFGTQKAEKDFSLANQTQSLAALKVQNDYLALVDKLGITSITTSSLQKAFEQLFKNQ